MAAADASLRLCMRPAPPLLHRLPEQYFTRVLAAVEAARAEPGERLIDLGRGNPDLPPPPPPRRPELPSARVLAGGGAAGAGPGERLTAFGRATPPPPPPREAIEAVGAAALEPATPLVHGSPPFAGHGDLKAAIAARYA